MPKTVPCQIKELSKLSHIHSKLYGYGQSPSQPLKLLV